MDVDVWLNCSLIARSRGYAPDDPLMRVAVLVVAQGSDQEALAHALWLTTDAHSPQATAGRPDPQAVAYRASGHRALRRGDVLVVNGRAWACAQYGWTPLPDVPLAVRGPVALAG